MIRSHGITELHRRRRESLLLFSNNSFLVHYQSLPYFGTQKILYQTPYLQSSASSAQFGLEKSLGCRSAHAVRCQRGVEVRLIRWMSCLLTASWDSTGRTPTLCLVCKCDHFLGLLTLDISGVSMIPQEVPALTSKAHSRLQKP